MKLSPLLAAYLATLVIAHEAHEDSMANHNTDLPESSDSKHIQHAPSLPSSLPANSTMEPSPISMHGGHHHGRKNILEDPNLEPQQRAYWELYDPTTFFSAPAPRKSFLYAHIVLNVAAWAFVYPVSLALSVAKSPRYLIAQTFQFALFLAALFALAVYGATAPHDLYPGNAYSRMSVAMLFITSVHWVAAIVKACAAWAVAAKRSPMDGADYVLANMAPSAGHFIRPSQDSGHGADSDSSLTAQDEEDDDDDLRLYDAPLDTEPSSAFETSSTQNRLVSRIMSNPTVYALVSRLETAARIVYAILNRPLFVVGVSYLFIGTVTVYRLGMQNRVYNILAHFIKGGVFFFYGVLTLLRYMGAFADRGMAWNALPVVKTKKGKVIRSLSGGSNKWFNIPSMEFIECALIFIYGSTNVFMEHLGNTTGEWSHKDLQHISIAFMYFGGGLCGLLIESATVRRLVNRTLSTSNDEAEDQVNSGMLGSLSLNPLPAFIVFWTGVLMSQHEQAMPLSTTIHMQWGYLFSVGALFRFTTYLVMFLKPPTSTVPSRPATELVTSFCLLCGGLVFMQSNTETVEAMIYRSLDGMFTLNVTVGITALIMAWIMVVSTIKAWASRRQPRLALSMDA
ncbi:hypothetical protein D0Z00_001738 [Geotrichum galactomycetum]|uniref:Uncharacterized protein n=1 Tax=Geotrichum galactomycetum TaxID=27317 RepID=A0ACB6V681_9ASCO|nr:hypothetical protein D0Z00_001738 [Geotrichum candidum]